MAGLLNWLDHGGAAGDPLWHFPAEGIDRRLSELRTQSGAIAAGLAARGIRPGDRVVMLLDTGSAAVSLLLALWQLQAVPVPLRPWSGTASETASGAAGGTDRAGGFLRFLLEVTRRSDARLVVTDRPAVVPQLEPLLTTVEALEAPLERLPATIGDCRADGLALIQFSSGSTGQPKGVMVTHAMVMAQLRQLADNYAAAGSGRSPRSIASWLPFYHDMGLFIGILLPLFTGADAMVAPPAWYMRNPARWFAAMAARGSDLTFSTSSVLAATLRGVRRLHGRGCDLSALILYVAAEKISPAVLDEAAAVLAPLGMPPSQLRAGYGMAEYTLGCTHSRDPGLRRLRVRIAPGGRVLTGDDGGGGDGDGEALELVSVGRPNDSCDLVVRDEAGHPLGELRLGEITVAGPCLTPGYWRDEAMTQRALGRGWMRSGDLGFLHDGELFFVARKDEMLVVGGRNVIPADVELEVESLPFVGPGRAVLFGADEPGGPRQVLLVEGNAASPPPVVSGRLTAIRRCILDGFGFVPTDIAVVPKGTIEKTSSGKKRTAVIRRRWQAGAIPQLA
ncbi:AMP-binding protein [Azospirillum melinis]|uniref:AMP-binding protein n=1 Tax=Azospirillum melinis TaxID=328839 RepID=A0ABX2KIV9_9PROT|nr:AMP-binding protein [Azospirillum melinis]MBP2309475.1 acyl-CoA synthetase (AMP-forming)/AMP-acid ligase II [Azospirillum melinis]NUB02653.1 AMP-binding protein [Azospirillum melinis]